MGAENAGSRRIRSVSPKIKRNGKILRRKVLEEMILEVRQVTSGRNGEIKIKPSRVQAVGFTNSMEFGTCCAIKGVVGTRPTQLDTIANF